MNKNLKDEIDGYCKVNKIKDVDKFIEKLIRQGFTIEKYGMVPDITLTKQVKVVPSNQTNIIDQIAEIEKEAVKVKEEKITKKTDTDLYGE